MKLVLSVTAGPHAGKEFTFDRHDTFLVGRVADAHFRLSTTTRTSPAGILSWRSIHPAAGSWTSKAGTGPYVNGQKVSTSPRSRTAT